MKKLTLSLALVMLGVLLSCSDLFAAPSKQARYVFMQSITHNAATAKWLYNGDGDGRIIVLRADNDWTETNDELDAWTTGAPIVTDADGDLSSAPEIGSTGSYIVDYHTDNTKSRGLSNLDPGTTYWIRLYEWDEDAGTYAYFTGGESPMYNNPRYFVTLPVVPLPPTEILVNAGNCFFDIEWEKGDFAVGTIMSLYYDASDSEGYCSVEDEGYNDFDDEFETIEPYWEMIDLGEITSIQGFPIETFNHDQRVRMWGYNTNVDNPSATWTDQDFAPIPDCDGPVATITVNKLVWDEETEEWVLGDEVALDECTSGERFLVTISFDENVTEFDETYVSLVGAEMVEGTWTAGEDEGPSEFSFQIEMTSTAADISIETDDVKDCVGNIGPGSDPFTFSVDNAAPTVENVTTFEDCFTGWYFNETEMVYEDLGITICFDASDLGCCSELFDDASLSVEVFRWIDEESSVLVSSLDISEGEGDYCAMFTLTSEDADGEYFFRITATDCLDNETIHEEFFTVDQTAPAITQVECVTEEEETTCEAVGEGWEGPCVQAGEEVTVCVEVVEEGCGLIGEPIYNYVGDFAQGLWSFDNPGNSELFFFTDPLPLGNGLHFRGSYENTLIPVTSTASITVAQMGIINFTMIYYNDGLNPALNPFGYRINGNYFQMSDDLDLDGQITSFSVFVNAGDELQFELESENGSTGQHVDVYDFSFQPGGVEYVFNPELGGAISQTVSGSGTTEDPYLFCFTYIVDELDAGGQYDVTVIAEDNPGNMSSLLIENAWSVDNTAPNYAALEGDLIQDCLGEFDEIDFCFYANDGEIGCGIETITAVMTFADETTHEFEILYDEETPGFYCIGYTAINGTTPEGDAIITITITDYAGNVTEETYTTTFDFTAPALVGEATYPEDTCLGEGDSFCVSFTLEDLGCGVNTETSTVGYWFNNSGDYSVSFSLDEETMLWDVTVCYYIGSEESGDYDFYFAVDDYAGNTFVIDIENAFTIDNDVPEITDLAVDDDCVTSTDVVTITFNAEDAFTCCVDSFFDVWVTLEFSNSTTTNAVFVGAVENSGGGWDYTFEHTVLPANPEGTVLVTAYAEDCAGNTGSAETTFEIDRTAPVVDNLTVEPNDCIAPGETFWMTFDATDAGCGILDCDAAWAVLTFADESTLLVEFFEDEEGNCTAEVGESTTLYSASYTVGPNDPAGPVDVAVYVVDGAGNEGSQTLMNAVTIDNVPPVVENITAYPTCATMEDVVTICFDASDIGCGDFDDANLEVVVWFGESSWAAEYDSNEGDAYCFTFYVMGSATHPSGFYSVTVTATDEGGNVTTETGFDLFEIVHAPVMAEWSVDYNSGCEYTNANPICFTFDFDREVFDFTTDDVNVYTYGFEVASVTYDEENDEWIVCVNALSGSGTGTLYMDISGVYDCAGNEYYGYTSANYDYDAPSGYEAFFSDEEGGDVDYFNAETCDDVYVTVEDGEVGSVANWTIQVGEVVYSGSFVITGPFHTELLIYGFGTIYDFTENFAPENWTIVEESNATAVFIGNTILLMTSADDEENPGNYNADATIEIPVDGTVSFDWDYETSDVDGPGLDDFGYLLNGTFYQLSDDDGDDIQSGSAVIPVNAGDEFGFRQNAVDGVLGEAITEINNFMFVSDDMAPLVLCYDEEGPVDLTVTLTDCAGNEGEEATDDAILDVTPPCLTIDAPANVNDDFDVEFTWTEDVVGFDVTDLVVTNGSTYDFAGSGANYTVGIAPDSEGPVYVTILTSGHGITDLAGNPFNGEDSECNDESETNYDITPPVFTTIGWEEDNIELLIYWNEAVMGGSPVDLADLTLTFNQNGGTATDATLVAVDHTEGDDFAYLTIEVEGTPNGCETIVINPATSNSVFDLAGNAQDDEDYREINLMNASYPEEQASQGYADNVYAVQARLNWTRGDGDAVLVVLFEANDCNATPVNGTPYYADSEFGYGDFLSCATSDGGYVVYMGGGTNVVVDGLQPCTEYRAVVYELIGGECDNPNYLTPGHEFEFITAPAATQLIITHVNGVPYDNEDCDFALPSGSIFSVTVGLYGADCDTEDLVPAYLTDEGWYELSHYYLFINQLDPLASESWPISQQSKTFSNLQFDVNDGCGTSAGTDAYFDPLCWNLGTWLYGYDYYLSDYGPMNLTGGEPGAQAYGISFSGTTNSEMTVSWSKPNSTTATGKGSLLLFREASAIADFPQDGMVYDAPIGVSPVSFINDGEAIGGGKAMYYQLDCACDEEHARSVTIQDLKANTTYYARVFEFSYDVGYVNGDFYYEQEEQEGPEDVCEYADERFMEQALVVNYRHSTGMANPRNRKTLSMEGMFAGLELINFDGRSFERQVELNWATASEGGSLGFEIYRADAETFEFTKIANVAGNVNGGTYKLVDDDSRLEVGKTYIYRLAYIAKDGSIEELSEVRVAILTMPNSIHSVFVSKVTPNPVVDFGQLTVEMSSEQNLRIEVRNAAGQLVSVLSDQVLGAGVHNFTIDLTNRAQGSYNILVTTDYEAIYVPFMYVK